MAQGYLVHAPERWWTEDDDGNTIPAVGFRFYTYEVNSTTPKATYSDGQLLSLNENPVETDADGFYRIWVARGESVKIVVKDADDNPITTFDYQQPMVAEDAAGDSGSLEIGMSMDWPDPDNIPTGWLNEDGSAVSRTTYATLNALYAGMTPPYPFGNGNGTTTFNLKDTRGRFKLYQAASGTGDTIGDTGGALDHTHPQTSHTHPVTVTRDGWDSALNNPSTTGRLNVGDADGAGALSSSYQPANDLDLTSGAGGTGDTGEGNPAYIVVGCSIVKAL